MNKSKKTGLNCFLVVGKLCNFDIPASVDGSFEECDDVYTNIIKIGKELDLKVKAGVVSFSKVEKSTSVVIAERKDETFIILLKRQEDKWMVLDTEVGKPELVDKTDLYQKLSGRIILLGKKSKDISMEDRKFGFSYFLPFILKFKKQFVCVLLSVFFIQILGILTPLMTQVVVDKVLTHHALNTLYTIAVGVFIVYIYDLIINLCKTYLFVHTTNRIDVLLSDKVFKHLFGLPLNYFESRRVGETVARVRELDQIRSFLTGTPLSSMIDVVFVTVYIVVLFFYSVPLTVIVLISLPLFALVSLVTTPLFKKSLDKKFETGAKSQSFLVESINGINTVKSFALEESFQEKYGELQADYVKASYNTQIIAGTSNGVASFISKVVDLVILVMGANLVIEGKLSIGQLVAFRMLSGRVSGPILRLVGLWQEYQQANLSVKRIGDIFNNKVERKNVISVAKIPKLEGAINFNNVRFRYRPDASDVLHGISFDIKPGKVIGLVGRSGSGKSTISKLIQKLYVPQSGRISIDGMDLSLIDPVFLRKQIGIVLQENFMFNGTVAENISMHCKQMSMEKIVEVAKIAGAHEFIMDLEEGYNTMIGEKGVSLSGGQKQRIAIARAIINDPKILIFDEATSALDYESEAIIQQNMEDICKGKTVIIIAHRLSTLLFADEIMVIDKGQIVEKGSHDDLMAQKGLYEYLYSKQSRGEVE